MADPTMDPVKDARAKAFDEIIEQLDAEIAKFKDCGDFTTAEVIEVVRAKVRAKRDPK